MLKVPPASLLIYTYKGQDAGYRLSSRHGGGYGDCPRVDRNSRVAIRIQNQGWGAPCYSQPIKSNRLGLDLFHNEDSSTLEIITLDDEGQPTANCQLALK